MVQYLVLWDPLAVEDTDTETPLTLDGAVRRLASSHTPTNTYIYVWRWFAGVVLFKNDSLLKGLPDGGVLDHGGAAAVHLTRSPQTAITGIQGGRGRGRGMRGREGNWTDLGVLLQLLQDGAAEAVCDVSPVIMTQQVVDKHLCVFA